MMIKRLLSVLGMVLFSTAALAVDDSLGDVADTVLESLSSVEQMILVVCYIAGIGFAGAGILKFKQHKDNPSQVPLGTPIMMIFIAAALIYLPQVIRTTGVTLFGDTEWGAGQYLDNGINFTR